MNALFNTAFAAFRWWLGTAQFDRVSELVRKLIFSDMPGTQKKELVIEQFWDEVERLRKAPAGILIDGIIFFTRLKYEARVGT
jgi:hypothetical protein